MAACQHKVEFDKEYHISLSEDNTYVAGQPVEFEITGNMDNILFYSGESGSEYIHRDRFHVSADQIKSATLTLQTQARYKDGVYKDALKIYVTDTFDGLRWDDGKSDRLKVKEMSESGMEGWTALEYVNGPHQEWVTQSFDITDYVDNFAVAFHWCPKIGEWGKYYVIGDVCVEVEGMDPLHYNLHDFNINALMMSDTYSPYETGSANGQIYLNSVEYDFGLMGSTGITHEVDGWVFSTPEQLGKVECDRGTVIKTIETTLNSYEYTWDKPGSYKVTFVSTDYVDGRGHREVLHFNINIVSKLSEE